MRDKIKATTKANNKAFKSKKATKGALRDQAKGISKTSHQVVLAITGKVYL